MFRLSIRAWIVLITLIAVSPVDASCGSCCSCCCEDSDCCDCCCCCCCDPGGLTVRAGAVFLERSSPSSFLFAENYFNTDESIDFSDYNFRMAAGPSVSAVWRRGGRPDVELGYFGVESTASEGLQNLNAITIYGYQYYGIFGGPLMNFPTRYGSRLHSTELNLRWQPSPRWTTLAGLRWVELNELFEATTGAPFDVNLMFRSRNHMYGFQIGGEANLYDSPKFNISGTIKTGIYANCAAQHCIYEIALFADRSESAGRTTQTAFLGEAELAGTYQVNRDWSIRAGYRVLCVEGVALATDQWAGLSFNETVSGGTPTGNPPFAGILTSGSPFYHGAMVQLEYRR